MKSPRAAFASRLTVACAALSLLSPAAWGQTTATLGVNATVLIPLTLSCATPLSFGSIDTSQTGDIIMEPDGSIMSGASLMLPAIAPQPGRCTLDGADGRDVTLSFTPVTLTHTTDNTQTLSVTEFMIDSAASAFVNTNIFNVTLQNGGGEDVNIGATLYITGGEMPGDYTGQSTVTVNYQ